MDMLVVVRPALPPGLEQAKARLRLGLSAIGALAPGRAGDVEQRGVALPAPGRGIVAGRCPQRTGVGAKPVRHAQCAGQRDASGNIVPRRDANGNIIRNSAGIIQPTLIVPTTDALGVSMLTWWKNSMV